MSKIRLPAQIKSLESLTRFVSAYAQKQGFDEKRIHEIELATEEALVNIFHYAYTKDQGYVELKCTTDNHNNLVIEILDTGIPFDILSIPDPDINANTSERKIGGLGIFLIRKMMNEVKYRREGGKNILTFIVHKTR